MNVTRLRTIEKQLSHKIQSGYDRSPRLRAEIEEFFFVNSLVGTEGLHSDCRFWP